MVLHNIILNLSNDVGTLQQQLGGKPKTTAARINSTNNNTNNNHVVVEEKEDKDQQDLKKWSHKIDNCWRKHPEIAPSEWKKKAGNFSARFFVVAPGELEIIKKKTRYKK